MPIELLDSLDVIIGILIGLLALLGGLTRWFWRRVESQVTTGVSGLTLGHDAIDRRLVDVETDLVSLKSQVSQVNTKVGEMERSMNALASKDDVNALKVTVAGIAERTVATQTMVESLYRSLSTWAREVVMLEQWAASLYRVETEKRRLEVLEYLAAASGYQAAASLLRLHCVRIGVPTTIDQMMACVAWLQEQELVTASKVRDELVVRITREGREVAEGGRTHPGVLRPDP